MPTGVADLRVDTSKSKSAQLSEPLLPGLPCTPKRAVSESFSTLAERACTTPQQRQKFLSSDGGDAPIPSSPARRFPKSGGLPTTSIGGNAVRHRSLSPVSSCTVVSSPRSCVHHRSRSRVMFVPIGGAASDGLTFPHENDCVLCRAMGKKKSLRATEVRWGTGLCDTCYLEAEKFCRICESRLALIQLHWNTGLCDKCYAVDKTCRICHSQLEVKQVHWRTGLCDSCYDNMEKTCRMCRTRLRLGQLRWCTGLCNECYDNAEKTCKLCQGELGAVQLRWGTGLCDPCYNTCEKTCYRCDLKLSVGQLHWDTGLCDACYDQGLKLGLQPSEKKCTTCSAMLDKMQKHRSTGLCDECYGRAKKHCSICEVLLISDQLRWNSGLCDSCYDQTEKKCKNCDIHIALGQLHWASGLCDSCYNKFDKHCAICQHRLPLGQYRYGTGLCNSCYDSMGKECRSCHCALQLGELHWGTGLCNSCYTAAQKRDVFTGLNQSVWALIGAQLVFYMAPSMLAPSLYVIIRENYPTYHAASAYSRVLVATSVLTMLAPVPLGLWADARGEREVYLWVTIVAALASGILVLLPSMYIFALAWGLLAMPPAIRGVRAAYFAKHVDPQELSKAGQLASTLGLVGGVLGPFTSSLTRLFVSTYSPDGPAANFESFRVCVFFGAVAHGTCAFNIALRLPAQDKFQSKGNSSGSSVFDMCDVCHKDLNDEEKEYDLALCNDCYDRYGGSNYNFRVFQKRLLYGFCLLAGLLEFSENAGVIATLQPIAVNFLDEGPPWIAMVNLSGACLSVVVSMTLTKLRLPENTQLAAAALLYLGGVIIYTAPPLVEWHVVLGVMLGLKAQIIFMAPFTAIFSRIIGRTRMNNRLTMTLCLAPLIGGALGTLSAPMLLEVAGTPYFMLAAAPAACAVGMIGLKWNQLKASQ